jgi:hypothetical protein
MEPMIEIDHVTKVYGDSGRSTTSASSYNPGW